MNHRKFRLTDAEKKRARKLLRKIRPWIENGFERFICCALDVAVDILDGDIHWRDAQSPHHYDDVATKIKSVIMARLDGFPSLELWLRYNVDDFDFNRIRAANTRVQWIDSMLKELK